MLTDNIQTGAIAAHNTPMMIRITL